MDAIHDPTDEKRKLIELNIRMGVAEQSRDETFLCQVLADDLHFRRASGTVIDKESYFTDLRKPENTYDYLQSEDVEATVYENVAVVSLLVRAKGTRNGNHFEGIYRNIRIFLKQPDWQCRMWLNVLVKDLSRGEPR